MSMAQYTGGHPAYPTAKYGKESDSISNELTVPKAGGKSSASMDFRSASKLAHKSTSAANEASGEAHRSGVGEEASSHRRAAIAHHQAAMDHMTAAEHPLSGFSKVYHDKMVDHHLTMERHHDAGITQDNVFNR